MSVRCIYGRDQLKKQEQGTPIHPGTNSRAEVRASQACLSPRRTDKQILRWSVALNPNRTSSYEAPKGGGASLTVTPLWVSHLSVNSKIFA
jgi:hypothetical protein